MRVPTPDAQQQAGQQQSASTAPVSAASLPKRMSESAMSTTSSGRGEGALARRVSLDNLSASASMPTGAGTPPTGASPPKHTTASYHSLLSAAHASHAAAPAEKPASKHQLLLNKFKIKRKDAGSMSARVSTAPAVLPAAGTITAGFPETHTAPAAGAGPISYSHSGSHGAPVSGAQGFAINNAGVWGLPRVGLL